MRNDNFVFNKTDFWCQVEPWRREPQGRLRILFEHDDLTYD